jgi:hypothetical protein
MSNSSSLILSHNSRTVCTKEGLFYEKASVSIVEDNTHDWRCIGQHVLEFKIHSVLVDRVSLFYCVLCLNGTPLIPEPANIQNIIGYCSESITHTSALYLNWMSLPRTEESTGGFCLEPHHYWITDYWCRPKEHTGLRKRCECHSINWRRIRFPTSEAESASLSQL